MDITFIRNFTFTPDQLEKLHTNSYCEDEPRTEGPEGYEGWYIESDTDSGNFDSEKGSMCDYTIDLFDDEDEFMGEAIGGYFNACAGECFNSTLTFTPPKPPTKSDELNDFLRGVMCNDSYDEKVDLLKEYLVKQDKINV